jgi:hypothetical protein
MESIIEKLILGAIGGLVAYWFAHRSFVHQRWWDKQYDLYIEAFGILKKITHALAEIECSIENQLTSDESEIVSKAYLEFGEGLSQIHGLQDKMILLGLDEASFKLTALYSALQFVHPSNLASYTDEDIQEIKDLVKQSKRMTEGCSGELAFLGRKKLEGNLPFIRKIKSLIKRRKAKKQLRSLMNQEKE